MKGRSAVLTTNSGDLSDLFPLDVFAKSEQKDDNSIYISN
jgi:hypothetical protein